MDIQISWETIFRLLLAGIVTYVIAPALLVLRDLVLWKIIEVLILNDKLRVDVELWASARWMLQNVLNKKPGFSLDSQGAPTSYSLDGKTVPKEAFDKYFNERRVYEERVTTLGPKLQFKNNLVGWLLRHYKQEGEQNPVSELINATIEDTERRSKTSPLLKRAVADRGEA